MFLLELYIKILPLRYTHLEYGLLTNCWPHVELPTTIYSFNYNTISLTSNQLLNYSLNSTYNYCALKNLQFIFQEKNLN